MKYSIKSEGKEVKIAVEGVGSKHNELMQELQACAEGRCACPTQQFEKLEAMEVKPEKDSVSITLKVKSGERIDQADINNCLAHTTNKVEKG